MSKNPIISKKKEDFLKNGFDVKIHYGDKIRQVTPDEHQTLVSQLHDGVNITKKNAKFLAVEDIKQKKTAYFLVLDERTDITKVYGTALLRILSNKIYSVRTTKFLDGKVVVKWSDQINGNFIFPLKEKKGEKTDFFDKKASIKSLAYLAGIMEMGELDWNIKNYLQNKKTERITKIDNCLIVVAECVGSKISYDQIFGSAISNDFLRIFLVGQKCAYAAHIAEPFYYCFKKLEFNLDSQQKIDYYSQIYHCGIDLLLLEELELRFLDPENDDLKQHFLTMMEAIENLLELSKDSKFFEEFNKRFSEYVTNDKQISDIYDFFQQNCEDIKSIYGPFLEYAKKLRGEEFLEMTAAQKKQRMKRDIEQIERAISAQSLCCDEWLNIIHENYNERCQLSEKNKIELMIDIDKIRGIKEISEEVQQYCEELENKLNELDNKIDYYNKKLEHIKQRQGILRENIHYLEEYKARFYDRYHELYGEFKNGDEEFLNEVLGSINKEQPPSESCQKPMIEEKYGSRARAKSI